MFTDEPAGDSRLFESIWPSLQGSADADAVFESDAILPLFEMGGRTKCLTRSKDMIAALNPFKTHMDAERDPEAKVIGADFEWPSFDGGL